MNRKRCLNHQRQKRGDDDRPRAKLVHLDVRLAAPHLKRVVHRLTACGGLAAAGADGCATPGFSSFFISRGRSDSRTSTSSRRSRWAAGLMRICLNGLPAFIPPPPPPRTSPRTIPPHPLVAP